jgi:DNA-directed RNA polymerase specialized sigma subunit
MNRKVSRVKTVQLDDYAVQKRQFDDYVEMVAALDVDMSNKQHVKGVVKTYIEDKNSVALEDVVMEFWDTVNSINLTLLERQVLDLYHRQEMSQQDIAKELNISQQRVSFIIRRIIKKVVRYSKNQGVK